MIFRKLFAIFRNFFGNFLSGNFLNVLRSSLRIPDSTKLAGSNNVMGCNGTENGRLDVYESMSLG